MDRVINILALFFICLGLLGLVEFGVEVYHSKLHLGLRLLLLPAGVGLLFRKEIWRKFSLFVLCLFAAVIGIVSVGYFFHLERIAEVFVQRPPIDFVYAVLLFISLVACIGSFIYLLERKDVKALFKGT